jgi:hypothetical protein
MPITSPDMWSDTREDVEYLVFSDSRFIVYVDHDMDIQWETSDVFDDTFEQRDEKSKEQYYNVILA